MSRPMPPAEVEIGVATATNLLAEQWPLWRSQTVETLAHGWDNVLYRVGREWVARFPRREMAVELVANEVRWLPGLAVSLPLPVPAPEFVGEPGPGYPWPWTVVPWIPGDPVTEMAGIDLERCVSQLAAFLAALHQPAPPEAPANPFRGVPLAERDGGVQERIEQLGPAIDAPAIRAVWRRSLAITAHGGQPLWVHGDMHPGNLLVSDGELSGVIDFGDITSGDPATDLAVAWMLFPLRLHPMFRHIYALTDDTVWERARGWALVLGLAFLANSADSRAMLEVGERTVARVLADHRLTVRG